MPKQNTNTTQTAAAFICRKNDSLNELEGSKVALDFLTYKILLGLFFFFFFQIKKIHFIVCKIRKVLFLFWAWGLGGWMDCDFTSFLTVCQSYQGPVVPSIVSLKSLLRGQLIKCFTTI